MAIGKNGEIFIAWQDERDIESAKKAGKEFKGLSLYYSWSDDGGKHFHPNKSIADHVCECCRIDTAIAQDNTPLLPGGIFLKAKYVITPLLNLRTGILLASLLV